MKASLKREIVKPKAANQDLNLEKSKQTSRCLENKIYFCNVMFCSVGAILDSNGRVEFDSDLNPGTQRPRIQKNRNRCPRAGVLLASMEDMP